MTAGGLGLAIAGLLVDGADLPLGAPDRAGGRAGGAGLGGAAGALLPRPGDRSAAEVWAWFFLVPVVGVATAWPLLGETPTVRLAVGLVGVCAGLWLVVAARGRPEGRLVDSTAPQ
jgi:hypothetical protein